MPADGRAARWAAIDPEALWAPVRLYFPTPPARVLEIGAGSGRDADWFEQLGFAVTCVEPDRALWPKTADWTDCSLPQLSGLAGSFDLIVLSAVWHVLDEAHWGASLDRLVRMAQPSGRMIMSLRAPPFKNPDTLVALARLSGWQCRAQTRQPSVQSGNRMAGVMWDWCVFERVASQ